jgi:hypothetical protein
MVNQRHCPYCQRPAKAACDHLALAVPGRDFVHSCIDAAQALRQWKELCAAIHEQAGPLADWSTDREDFTWLETAFCQRFLKSLHWFGGIDHEWRTGERLDKGGFYVLLWSKSPQRLWWELLDHLDRQLADAIHLRRLAPEGAGPGLFSYDPRQMTLEARARL